MGGEFGDGVLQPAEHPVQPSDAQHPENLGHAASLDKVVWNLEHLANRRAIETRNKDRDEPTNRGRLDRRVREEANTIVVSFGEQENGGLALGNPVSFVFELRKTIRQRRKRLREIDQKLDPLLPVRFLKFPNNLRKRGRHVC